MKLAYVHDQWKPVISSREVKRGRRKGMLEVNVRMLVGDGDEYAFKSRKRFVWPHAIRTVKDGASVNFAAKERRWSDEDPNWTTG